MSDEPIVIGCDSVWCESCGMTHSMSTTNVDMKRTYNGKRTTIVHFFCPTADEYIERDFKLNTERIDMLLNGEIYNITKPVSVENQGIERLSVTTT